MAIVPRLVVVPFDLVIDELGLDSVLPVLLHDLLDLVLHVHVHHILLVLLLVLDLLLDISVSLLHELQHDEPQRHCAVHPHDPHHKEGEEGEQTLPFAGATHPEGDVDAQQKHPHR